LLWGSDELTQVAPQAPSLTAGSRRPAAKRLLSDPVGRQVESKTDLPPGRREVKACGAPSGCCEAGTWERPRGISPSACAEESPPFEGGEDVKSKPLNLVGLLGCQHVDRWEMGCSKFEPISRTESLGSCFVSRLAGWSSFTDSSKRTRRRPRKIWS